MSRCCIKHLYQRHLICYIRAVLRIAYHPSYSHPLPEGHRFPMLKYELIPEQLLYEGIVAEENFFEPAMATKDFVKLAHREVYLDHLLDLTLDPKMVRRIGFPLSRALVDRELYIVGGTIEGCRFALKHKVAFNVAGGTHHAGADFGEGFCLLNDQAVGAAYLLHEKLANRIAIIDLDVHQGNGTAHIFRKNEQVFTFSMHGEKNYPFLKERSHLDIGLENGVGNDEYLAMLDEHLHHIFVAVKPDFVFYQSGVDVLSTDKLGKLNLTASGCRKRDEMVFDYCRQYAVPVQVSMGGGYSSEIRDIVNAHVGTYRAAIDVFDLV